MTQNSYRGNKKTELNSTWRAPAVSEYSGGLQRDSVCFWPRMGGLEGAGKGRGGVVLRGGVRLRWGWGRRGVERRACEVI